MQWGTGQRPGPVVDVVELNGEPVKGPRIPPVCGKHVIGVPTSINLWIAGAQDARISALPSQPGHIRSLPPEAGICRQQKLGKWQCLLDFPDIGLFERHAFFLVGSGSDGERQDYVCRKGMC